MFKRLFWIGLGVVLGVIVVSKARSYIKANTPDAARQFLLGPDLDHVTVRTLKGLLDAFNDARRGREEELNRQYAQRRG